MMHGLTNFKFANNAFVTAIC